MTTNYNRSQIYSFNDLSELEQAETINETGFELSDCHSTLFVKFNPKNYTNPENNKPSFLPLCMFMKTGSAFTHGVYSTSAFDGYFVTFDRSNDYCIIAHKYF